MIRSALDFVCLLEDGRILVLEYKNTIHIEPLQAFVGENNAGKSSMLGAIEVLLRSGFGGVSSDDFSGR